VQASYKTVELEGSEAGSPPISPSISPSPPLSPDPGSPGGVSAPYDAFDAGLEPASPELDVARLFALEAISPYIDKMRLRAQARIAERRRGAKKKRGSGSGGGADRCGSEGGSRGGGAGSIPSRHGGQGKVKATAKARAKAKEAGRGASRGAERVPRRQSNGRSTGNGRTRIGDAPATTGQGPTTHGRRLNGVRQEDRGRAERDRIRLVGAVPAGARMRGTLESFRAAMSHMAGEVAGALTPTGRQGAGSGRSSSVKPEPTAEL